MPTGLDRGARQALLRLLHDAGLTDETVLAALFEREVYGDTRDYLVAVAEVWGQPTADDLIRAARDPFAPGGTPLRLDRAALLLAIPEPDFLTAVEASAPRVVEDPFKAVGLRDRINAIC